MFARPFPKPSLTNSLIYEVAPELIVNQVRGIIENALPFKRLYLSTQMHGYLLADEDHRLLTPYISWQDQRSLSAAGAADADTENCWFDLFPVQLPLQSGTAVKPNLPVCSLFALQQMHPERFARAKHFYTLGSYLMYCLTGKNTTHITDAAATGLYYAWTGQPLDLLFPALSIPQAKMDLLPAAHWRDAEVMAPIGDQQASVYGSGIVEDLHYVLNLGTAGQLCVVAKGFVSGSFESRPYFSGTTLCTVTRLPGGREIAASAGDGSRAMAVQLADIYREAMNRLPRRNKLIVIGGAARHHKDLLEEVCERIGIEWELRPSPDALDGLSFLSTDGYREAFR